MPTAIQLTKSSRVIAMLFQTVSSIVSSIYFRLLPQLRRDSSFLSHFATIKRWKAFYYFDFLPGHQYSSGEYENRNSDFFCKPTDKHQCLLHSSSHPFHTKKSIPYSLALRLRRICSTDACFDNRSTELKNYLTKRGYKDDFVKEQIRRTKGISWNKALKRTYT